MQTGFRNRREAGRELGRRLERYEGASNVTVLALPRGGVPVAFEVARALGAGLDVLLVREQPDLIQETETNATSAPSYTHLAVDERSRERKRERTYRGDREPLPVTDRTVVLVDDGLASTSSLRNAVQELRRQAPRRLVVALPFSSPAMWAELADDVDEIICARSPEPFRALALWYDDFAQPSDEEVHALIARASEERYQLETQSPDGVRTQESS